MRYIITWIIHKVTKVQRLLVLAFIGLFVKIYRLIFFFCLIYLDGFGVCFPILYFYLLYRLVTCPYKTLKKVYTISIINFILALISAGENYIKRNNILFLPVVQSRLIKFTGLAYTPLCIFFIKIFIYLTVYLPKKFQLQNDLNQSGTYIITLLIRCQFICIQTRNKYVDFLSRDRSTYKSVCSNQCQTKWDEI